MLNIRSKLYIVEVLLADVSGNCLPATVPSYLNSWIGRVYILCKSFHIRRRCITAHKAYTGNVVAVFLHKSVNRVLVEYLSDIVPKITAVATGAMAGTVRDVDRESNLVWDLLKHDAAVYVFKHFCFPYSLCQFLLSSIITSVSLFLSGGREIADPLQVANDARHVVHVLAVAMRSFLEVSLVDIATVVTDGVWDIEREVVASLFGCNAQQLAVLFL